jgi:hypothetical protein
MSQGVARLSEGGRNPSPSSGDLFLYVRRLEFTRPMNYPTKQSFQDTRTVLSWELMDLGVRL